MPAVVKNNIEIIVTIATLLATTAFNYGALVNGLKNVENKTEMGLQNLDKKTDRIENKTDRVEGKVDGLSDRVSKMEGKLY